MKYLFLFSLFFLFTSCTQKANEKIEIVVNSWIGYTPFFYAQEKSYLKNLNIELITTVSLGESYDIFSVAKADMLTATQHEYNALKKDFPSLEPIILIDKSFGGDMILSNRTIKELQKSNSIDVYLEIDSINNEMIQEFTNKYHLDKDKINYINKDQSKIKDLPYSEESAIIIVTYSPYNIELLKTGYKELASTKNSDTIIVIDALFANHEFAKKHQKRLLQLKAVIDRSIQEIKTDPKAVYLLTKKYLNNISYTEYKKSLKMIQWINKLDLEKSTIK